MYRDQNSNLSAAESIRPQVAAGGVNGQTVDLRGYDSATVVVSVGAITGSGASSAVSIEESDTGTGGWTDVADADILGTEPGALTANSDYQFGYIGDKRYVRAVFALGAATNVAVSAMVVRGNPHKAPTANSGSAVTYTGS